MKYKVLKPMPRAKIGDVLYCGLDDNLYNDGRNIVICERLNDAITEGFITPIDEKAELPEKYSENDLTYCVKGSYPYKINQLIDYLKERE